MKQAIGIALELGEDDLLAELVKAAQENASACNEAQTYINMLCICWWACLWGGEWHVQSVCYVSLLDAVKAQSHSYRLTSFCSDFVEGSRNSD